MRFWTKSFNNLVENEAKRPEPTAAHVGKAFESFLRSKLRGKGLIVLSNPEMLFAYHLELNLLRTMAADDDRTLLLLPGRRGSGKIIEFPELEGGNYTLPTNSYSLGPFMGVARVKGARYEALSNKR